MPAAASGKFFFSMSLQIARMLMMVLFVAGVLNSRILTPCPSVGQITGPRKAIRAVEGERPPRIPPDTKVSRPWLCEPGRSPRMQSLMSQLGFQFLHPGFRVVKVNYVAYGSRQFIR